MLSRPPGLEKVGATIQVDTNTGNLKKETILVTKKDIVIGWPKFPHHKVKVSKIWSALLILLHLNTL